MVDEEITQVAFVPASVPLRNRTLRAIEWLEGLEGATGRRGGLVTPQKDDYGPLVESFRSGRRSTSTKTAASVGTPVLLYCLDLAGVAKFARSRPLVYVPTEADRWVDGWAAQLQAVDITTRTPVAAPSEEAARLLDLLDHVGNNGWFDQYGKRDAKRILPELDALVSRDYTVGAMLARGHSRQSLEALKKLRTPPPPSPPIMTTRQW